jgi:phosphatidylserine/phosphatidylglycerophosphate/cardiolipin synthase-like enzyme
MQQELLALIGCAQRRLSLAVYEVSWPCVVDALLARLEAAPDLEVRVLFDDERCPRQGGRLTCDLARLEGDPRVTIVDDGRSRYMHHKFVLADDARVWVSSANLTRESFCEDLNDALVVDEPAIVAAYAARFERLAVARDFGPSRTPEVFAAGGYTLRFSPESPVDRAPAWYRAILDAIGGATTSVDFMISSWTQLDVAEALVAAHERGVKVRGLVSELRTDDAPLARLLAAGVPVRMDEIHMKAVVVDGRWVAAGSPNWSANAWSNNEDSLHVESATVARAYVAELEALFPTARLP